MNQSKSRSLEDLTIVIPTLGRHKYVTDLLYYWQEIECESRIIVLDGTRSPLEIQNLPLSSKFKKNLKIYSHQSLWRRMAWCSTRIETPTAIWHADDDFLLPTSLAGAVAEVSKLKRTSVFSNVRGFDENVVQNEHPIEIWRKYELMSEIPMERAGKFARDRANRYFYAVWPSNLFAEAFLAMACANEAIEEKKLIFGDIGFELAGCLLSKLKIHDTNYLLKRENLISQPSHTNMPTLSRYIGNPANANKFELWKKLFVERIHDKTGFTEGEISEAVDAFFRTIVSEEMNRTRERKETRVIMFVSGLKFKFIDYKKSNSAGKKLGYRIGKYIYKNYRRIAFKPIPSLSWSVFLQKKQDQVDILRVGRFLAKQTNYPKEVVDI